MHSTLWQLWQSIQTPHHTSHPLYQRGRAAVQPIGGGLSCVLMFVVLFLLVPLLVFISTVIGAIAAATGADTVGREHEANTFDMLATTPAGAFGASLLLALGAIHRRDLYHRLQSWQTWIFRGSIIVIGVIIVEVLVMLSSQQGRPGTQINPFMWQILLVADMALILAVFYIDHIQALTLGVLCGLLLPTIARERVVAQTGAVVFYLFVRVMTLFTAFVVLFVFLSQVFAWLPDMLMMDILLDVIRLMLFALINEGVTVIVWYMVRERLNGDRQLLKAWRLPA